MRETLEQLRMHLWMVLHRRWTALVCAMMISAAGWGALALVPDKYEVQAKVYLDTQSVLKPLLRGLAVDDNVREQSAMIIQRTLLTPENIEKVVQSTDLRGAAANPTALEKTVLWLANSVKVDKVGVALGNNDREVSNIYSVSFRHKNADVAKQVVESVLRLFLEGVLGSSQQDSAAAAAFLGGQIKEYAAKLEEAEDRLKKFKLANPGFVPEPGGKTFADRVEGMQLQLEQARLALREAEFRAGALRGQASGMPTRVAIPGGGVAAVMNPIDVRIQTLELKLSELLASYTDQHPEVIATRRQLAEARDQKKRGDTGGVPAVGAVADPGALQLRVLLAQAEAEAAALRVRVSDYERQLVETKPLSENMPKVEAELAKLTRDYNIIKETYQQLVQRRQAAQLAHGAQQSADTSQFRIIEAPRIPVLPVFPDRQLFTTAILFAALAVGIAIAWVRAQANTTFYSRQQLATFSDIPVLGTVTMDWSFLEIARRRAGLASFALVFAALLSAYGWQMLQHGFDVKPYVKAIEDFKQKAL